MSEEEKTEDMDPPAAESEEPEAGTSEDPPADPADEPATDPPKEEDTEAPQEEGTEAVVEQTEQSAEVEASETAAPVAENTEEVSKDAVQTLLTDEGSQEVPAAETDAQADDSEAPEQKEAADEGAEEPAPADPESEQTPADTEANEEQQSDLKTPANDVTEAVSQDVGGGMEPITEEEPPSDEIVHSTVDESPRLPPERIDTRSPTDTAAAEALEKSSRRGSAPEAEGELEEEELSPMEKAPDRESLIEFYQQAMKDRETLMQTNTTLQNKLSEYFRRKRTEEGGPSGAGAGARAGTEQADRSVSDLEQRYLNFMTNLEELQTKRRESKENYETEIAAIKAQCEVKEGELNRMTSEFVEKRRQVALQAINSRTGKPLQREEIEMFMQNEQKKDMEVKAVRLENIKLKNRLQKREKQLKQKEELAEGLHLIDFEQLKIENQTYNEKIEERNEELSKLRKKITNTVEVLTHLKEKLQYIQQENSRLNHQLKGLDAQVAQKRDGLTKIKQNRDALRNENQELSRKCGLLGNETLLRDYEDKYAESTELKNRLSQLKTRHTELSMKCTGYKKKIEEARSGIMIT